VCRNACFGGSPLHDGYVLLSKRLERGRFDFPSTAETSRALRRSELIMFLEGVRLSDTKQQV